MPNEYADLTFVKKYLDVTDTSKDTFILNNLEMVSRWIDAHTRRRFFLVDETRVFDFQETSYMNMASDLYEITTFTNGNGEELILDTDFFAYPDEGPPYRWLEINLGSGKLFTWSGTFQRCIQIEGKWGYCPITAVPPQITAAVAAWFGYLITESEDSGISSKSDGGFSVSYTGLLESMKKVPGSVESLIAGFRNREFRGLRRRVVLRPQIDKYLV